MLFRQLLQNREEKERGKGKLGQKELEEREVAINVWLMYSWWWNGLLRDSQLYIPEI